MNRFSQADAQALAHRITFGSDNADALIGGKAADRLYAGAGNDYLRGGANDDYLEGGRGIDVYEFEATQPGPGFGSPRNDGNDSVRDIDGRGVLRFTDYRGALVGRDTLLGSTLVAGAFVADAQERNRWLSLDGRTVINRVPGAPDEGRPTDDLVVTRLDAQGARLGGSITLRDWRPGDFSIRLLDGVEPAEPRTVREILGGQVPDPTRVDILGNPETTPGTVAADVPNVLVGSAQADLIDGGGGNDVLRGDRAGAAPSTLAVGDWLRGGAGRDWLLAGPGENLLEGGGDGEATGDVLLGGAWRDRLYGDSNVSLAGAVLDGDPATYGARPGSQAATGQAGDFVDAGEGGDVVVTSGADDGVLGGGGDDVIVTGAGNDKVLGDLHGEYPISPFSRWRGETYGIGFVLSEEQMGPDIAPQFRERFVGIRLLPGTVMPQAAGSDLIYTGGGRDLVWSEGGDDTVDGGSGDDTLNGGAGHDVLIGGLGADFLAGDAPMDAPAEQGDDVLDGGDGDDALFGFAGSDILFGGAGNDRLEGGLGSDILVGGPGNDILRGGRGKDTYIFNRGDGVEFIDDPDDRGRTAATDGPGANPDLSVIVLGEGISAADVKFGRGSLLIDLGGGDAIHLELPAGETDPARYRMFDRIEFADGSVLTFDDFLQRGLDIEGTERVAAHPDDAGNMVAAQDGNDLLVGSDNALGGDRIRGLSGDDVIRGGAGDDLITGGRDNDTLFGGAGDDTYVFALGDGVDTVVDREGASVFRFGPGISAADLQVLPLSGVPDGEGNLNDVLDLYYDGAQGDHVLIVDGAAQGMNRYEFDDGTVLGQRDLLARFHGRLTVRGGSGDDSIVGGAGDDLIEGGAGDDTLEGGAGFDRLRGGAGDDTYLFDRGAGRDVVEDAQGVSTIRLGEGISAEDLAVTVSNAFDGSLYLRVELGNDVLTVPVDFRVGAEAMPVFVFADGSSLDGRALLAARGVAGYGFSARDDAVDLAGTGAADSLFGGRGDDSLTGNGGDDLLVGGAGVDFLDGGAGADDLDGDLGDDWLYGGVGADTYHLYRGGGLDTVFEESGETSALRLEGGLGLADLVVGREGDDVRLRIRRGDEGLLIKDYFTSSQSWTVTDGNGGSVRLEDLLAQPDTAPPVADIEAALAAFRDGARLYLEAALSRGGYVQTGPDRWIRDGAFTNGYFHRDTRMQVDLTTVADAGHGPQAAPAFIDTVRADSSLVERVETVTVRDTSQAYFVEVGAVGMVVPAAPVEFVAMLGAAYADPATWNLYPGYKEPVFGPVEDLPPGIRPHPEGGGGRQLLGFYLYPDNVIRRTVPDDNGVPRTVLVVPTVERQVTTTTVTEDYAWQVNLATARAGDGGGVLTITGGQAGIGGAGNDTLRAAGAMDVVAGARPDPLRRPGVLLYGAEGDDVLYGSDGDDLLASGSGVDLLVGGGGRDRYVILPGGGAATVFDLVPNSAVGPAARVANGANAPLAVTGGTVELPIGVTPDDLSFSWADEWLPVFRDSNRSHGIGVMADLSLKVATAVLVIDYESAAGRGQVRIAMPHAEDAGGIASLNFADGRTWSRATLLARAPAHSLDPNAAPNLAGGSGLDGEGGNDILTGAGILRGGAGDDRLAGSAGIDALTGDEGADSLAGGDGDDLLGFGIREFLGAGNVYRGGRGRDFLLGSVASDTFIYERGDGADVIGDFWHDPRYAPTAGGWLPLLIGGAGPGVEWGSAYSDAYYYGTGPQALPDRYSGTDVLQFGAGIAPGDLTFVRARGDAYDGVGAKLPSLPPNMFVPPGFSLPGTGIVVEDAGGADLVIRIGAGGDSVRIPDFFRFSASAYQVRGTGSFNAAFDRNFIGEIRFADGTVWDRARFDAALSSLGNRAPVATSAIDDIALLPGQVFERVLGSGAFSDPNPGDTLTYRLEGVDGAVPEWLHFDASARRLTGQAGSGSGDLHLRMVATDSGGLSAALPFTVRVGQANHAPVAGDGPASFTAWEDMPGYWFLPPGAFSDADADDVLRYEARVVGLLGGRDPLPAWLGIDPQTGGLYGAAPNEAVGTLSVEISAYDPSGASARRVFDLAIRNVNDAPRLAGVLGDIDVVAGYRMLFGVPRGLFDDVDAGDTLTLSLRALDAQGEEAELPDWLSFDAGAATLDVKGTDALPGTLHLRLRATDEASASASTDFALRVREAGTLPAVEVSVSALMSADAGGTSSPVPDDAAAGGEVGGAAPHFAWAALPEFGPARVDSPGEDVASTAPPLQGGASQGLDFSVDAMARAIDTFDQALEEAARAEARANAAVAGTLGKYQAEQAGAGLSVAALIDGLTRLHLETADGVAPGMALAGLAPFDLGFGLPGAEGVGAAQGTPGGMPGGLALGGALAGLGEGMIRLQA